ncbi:hypothetical protein [Roseomonas harenae]|uniref:hypothetical protein n=1 Tax=Muricoccus harenae TaxID=2692566 RepID=UPI001331585F|nr:hypothetical protein [Roseomonas harenae]
MLGTIVGLALIAMAWFLPAFLPSSIAEGMLQPAYRMEELVARFVPEVTAGMQRAFSLAAAAVFFAFVVLSLMNLVARPIGPGLAGSGWRRGVWVLLLLVVVIGALGATYLFLSFWLTTVDEAAATQCALYVCLAAALAYWLLSFVGTERMMRPAVPFASRLNSL